jgi:8-oxo-dGTP diphosphatase
MPEKNVICVVLTAIIKDGKILLLKRNKEPLKGYWGLVGGKLKEEESIEEACVRECKEETGIDVNFKGIKGILHERLYNKKDINYGSMILFTKTAPKTFKIKESGEGKVKWFSLKSLEKEKIILSDLWMIRNMLSENLKIYNGKMFEEKGKLNDMGIEIYGNHY